MGHAYSLACEADQTHKSLIIPAGILAAHPFENGNGRAARAAHAKLVGKTTAQIEELRICGPRYIQGTDVEAQAVVDLRPPLELQPLIDAHVYELAQETKKINLHEEHHVSLLGLQAFIVSLKRMSPSPQKTLKEVVQWSQVITWPDDEFYLSLHDKEGLEFALSIQNSSDKASDDFDLAAHLADLNEDGLEQVVADLWKYRLLRARATIDCTSPTTILGQRELVLPNQERRMSVVDHFIRLTNNLIKGSEVFTQ